ncbi:HAD family hydrolase [Salsuginibacillus kocurii]|uniref:HAD family hydrolase n=1 Tax=Salsuginibacillus kocurii TaxID=427078 RepID=UPI000382CBF2|nr:HAD family hydrolase [Salsuginibacillus kocurii]
MTYRLLALGIDNTMVKANGKMTKATKEAIDFVMQKGVHVVLLTHSRYEKAKKMAKWLKLDHEHISHGGAFIANSDNAPLYEERLSTKMATDIIDLLQSYPSQVVVEHEQFELTNRTTEAKNFLGKLTISLGESLFYPETVVDQLAEHVHIHDIMPLGLRASFENERDVETAAATLRSIFPPLSIRIPKKGMLECRSRYATKFLGLSYIGRELGIGLDEMVVVGGKVGDEEVLKEVGLGVAMGDAPSEVRDNADWVTRPVSQDGLPYMIREVFRKQMNVNVQR